MGHPGVSDKILTPLSVRPTIGKRLSPHLPFYHRYNQTFLQSDKQYYSASPPLPMSNKTGFLCRSGVFLPCPHKAVCQALGDRLESKVHLARRHGTSYY